MEGSLEVGFRNNGCRVHGLWVLYLCDAINCTQRRPRLCSVELWGLTS